MWQKIPIIKLHCEHERNTHTHVSQDILGELHILAIKVPLAFSFHIQKLYPQNQLLDMKYIIPSSLSTLSWSSSTTNSAI